MHQIELLQWSPLWVSDIQQRWKQIGGATTVDDKVSASEICGKCGEVQWTLSRQAEIVPRIDAVAVFPKATASTEDFPAGWWHTSALPPRRHSFKILHCRFFFFSSRVALATVDWNCDQFCENSTMLFTVSESGVYRLKSPWAHLNQSKVCSS